jgi:hypothetical protein
MTVSYRPMWHVSGTAGRDDQAPNPAVAVRADASEGIPDATLVERWVAQSGKSVSRLPRIEA